MTFGGLIMQVALYKKYKPVMLIVNNAKELFVYETKNCKRSAVWLYQY